MMSDEMPIITLPTEDMKTLLSYNVSKEDAKMYQEMYEEATRMTSNSDLLPQAKFQYAFSLVHSQNSHDVKKGAILFEEIFKEGSEDMKRDGLFCLAVAETRQKNYCTAKKYVKAFLSVEPSNIQAQQLDTFIQKQLKRDGITGMALVGAASLMGGAAAIVVGTLAIGAALGFSLLKKKGN